MNFPTDAIVAIAAVAIGFGLNEWSTRRGEIRTVRRLRAADERVALERLQEAIAALELDIRQLRFEDERSVTDQNARAEKREALVRTLSERMYTVRVQTSRVRDEKVRQASTVAIEAIMTAIAKDGLVEASVLKALIDTSKVIGDALRNDVPAEPSILPSWLARIFR